MLAGLGRTIRNLLLKLSGFKIATSAYDDSALNIASLEVQS
jgi:hypothetical protein